METVTPADRELRARMLYIAMSDDGLMARIMMTPPETNKGEE